MIGRFNYRMCLRFQGSHAPMSNHWTSGSRKGAAGLWLLLLILELRQLSLELVPLGEEFVIDFLLIGQIVLEIGKK